MMMLMILWWCKSGVVELKQAGGEIHSVAEREQEVRNVEEVTAAVVVGPAARTAVAVAFADNLTVSS
jgi:hypothetical protein